jgi:hypothetical protein
MTRFTVRNVRPTPAGRLNKKNNNNKYYFDVFDTVQQKITDRVYAATQIEADDKRTQFKNKINSKLYTTQNAVLGDAAQIEYNIQVGKRDNKIIKENTLRDYKFSWDAIKYIEHNGIFLKDYPIQDIDIKFLTSLENKLLIELSLRQNKSSWLRLGAILNVAATENMGVPMFITKQVSRSVFTSAWKRRKKKVPDILKTDSPNDTIKLINKVLDVSRLRSSYDGTKYPGNFYYITIRTLVEANQRISKIIPIETKDYSVKLNGFVIDKVVDIKTNVMEYLPRIYETDFANKGYANVVFLSEQYTKIYKEWLQELREWYNPKNIMLPASNGNYKTYHIILDNIKKLFKIAGWNGNISTHDFRSLGAKFRKYLELEDTSKSHLDHSSKHMTLLYERGRNWQDVKSLTAASNKIGQFYNN